MKKTYSLMLVGVMAFIPIARAVDRIVTTTAGTGAGSLTAAITALADGDTIKFAIPGAGPHFIQTPPDGYPLITKNNITIDGYSQTGASPNTASIHSANNAVLKIVLTSTNGNALSMQTAVETSFGAPIPRLGYGDDEQAILGFFHATNAVIRGLCIISAPLTATSITGGTCKSICFAANSAENGGAQCQNWRISGCWFGVDPVTKQVAYMSDGVTVATPGIAVASYRTRNATSPDNTTFNFPGTIGVPAGAANPRADFNVFITGSGFEAEGLNYRISGNFYGVLPDGMTSVDFSVVNGGLQSAEDFIEIGRNDSNVTIGTDGDGVNDADEGNVFGAWSVGQNSYISFYSDPRTNIVIAGNYFGVAIDGVTTFTNSCSLVDGLGGVGTMRVGSDFDGVSDALEANLIYNNNPFSTLYPDPTDTLNLEPKVLFLNTGAGVSFRGNVTVNNSLIPFDYANGNGTLLAAFTNYSGTFMDTNSVNGIVPSLATTNIFPSLIGTFAPGIAPYTTIILDVYELDPQGWANGQKFALSEMTDSSTYTNGFAQGKRYLGSFTVPNTGSFSITLPAYAGVVSVTANYSADPAGTHNGRVRTSNFSNPGYVLPGGAASVGLTQIVPDVACWFSVSANSVTNGFIKLADQPVSAALGNWEPYIGALGDSTFLIEFNTYANDGSFANQNNAVAKQPAAGGPAKVDYAFYADNGTPFKGALNLSRQNGNPGRVAGDLRYGANKFITQAETSLGQISAFQTVARWGNNDIYTSNNRYTAEQIFTLNTTTLVQTPVTNAWDYIYGNFVGVMGVGNNAPQVGRTGGRPNFLDNGNIVVMADDRSCILSTDNEVITFAIIQPNGAILKGPTLASTADIFDNMCAVKGGFVIRAKNDLLFFNNSGTLTFSNLVTESSGMTFSDANGRGDNLRISGDIRSYYVYAAGALSPGNTQAGVAAWDTRTGQFVGSSIVSDGDPAVQKVDRCGISVDALNRVCVAYVYQPDATFPQQVAARVAQFDGSQFIWQTHSFYPFVNHDQDPNNVLGYKTTNPYVAMNTMQICIAAKGIINSTNSATAGPDSLPEQTVYTVISQPIPVPAPRPVITMTKSGGNLNLSWNPEDGLFTVQTTSSLSSPTSWSDATVGNVASPVTIPAGTGPTFVRLKR